MVTNWTIADLPFIFTSTSGGQLDFATFSTVFRNSSDRWQIPLEYFVDDFTDENKRTRFLTAEGENEKSLTLPFIPQKILVTSGGNWRVLYSTQIQSILTKTIEIAHDISDRDRNFPAIQRAMLYQDIFYFARIGKVDYSKVFRLAASLKEEKEHFVFAAALEGFVWIKTQLEGALDWREAQWLTRYKINKNLTLKN